MKTEAWEVTQRSMIDKYQHFRASYFLHFQDIYSIDGGRKLILNIDTCLPNYTASSQGIAIQIFAAVVTTNIVL
jgi:hypothetical protein